MLPGVQPGQILAGKYRIERVLGAGGMGVVVAATHLALDHRVAIKFMLNAGTQAQLTRFVREARVAVRLQSEHIARVLDVETLDDGTPYIVLEYLDGKDFSNLLEEHGPLPVAEAIDAVLQAGQALREAHALGIVHRDLKPANLFATRRADGSRCVKVLDFGIAKWTNAGTEKLEASGVMGSASYMAPEQIAAPATVDARTDVWALGATLFHLLTGKPPFQYEGVTTPHAMIHAILYRPPLRPRSLRPGLAAEVETVLLRCLDKDPAARFGSMAALAEALAPLRAEVDSVSPAAQFAVATADAPRRKRMRGGWIGVAAVLFGAAIAVGILWRNHGSFAIPPSASNTGGTESASAPAIPPGAIPSASTEREQHYAPDASATIRAADRPLSSAITTPNFLATRPPRPVSSATAVPVPGSAPIAPDPLKDKLYDRRE